MKHSSTKDGSKKQRSPKQQAPLVYSLIVTPIRQKYSGILSSNEFLRPSRRKSFSDLLTPALNTELH